MRITENNSKREKDSKYILCVVVAVTFTSRINLRPLYDFLYRLGL